MMRTSTAVLGLSLFTLLSMACTEPAAVEAFGDSSAAMSRPPEELSALVGKEVLPYHYVKLTNNPNGSVGATGIYVNLTNKVVLPNETTAGFLQCDISIAQPWYADSRTTAVVEGEAFTIATVKDVVERDNGARTTFILDATRSHLDETQTVRMDCAAGGMSVLAYVSESDIFIR